MSFDADFAAPMSEIATALWSPVTVRLPNGETISTRAAIDHSFASVGDYESGATEPRVEMSLMRADVGTPERGWIVINQDDDKNYEIQEVQEDASDQFEVRVTVK